MTPMFDRDWHARPEDFADERSHFSLRLLQPLTAIVFVVRILPVLFLGLVGVFIGTGAGGSPGWLAALMAVVAFAVVGFYETSHRGHRVQVRLVHLLSRY